MRSFNKTRNTLTVFLTLALLTFVFLVLYVPKALSAPWTVNASVAGGTGGSVNPATQEVGVNGGSASIDITPEGGFHIDLITDNGTPVAGPIPAPTLLITSTKTIT